MTNGSMRLMDIDLKEIFHKYYIVQNFKEMEWLVNKVKKIVDNNISQNKPSIILEVGIEMGGTMKIWEQLLSQNGKGKENILIGIDISPNLQWDIKNSDITTELIIGNSHDVGTLKKVKNILSNRPLDFIYIDGEHTPEAARKDFVMYGNLIKKDTGAIGLHDVKDIKRFIDILSKNKLEIFEGYYPHEIYGIQQPIGTAIYYM